MSESNPTAEMYAACPHCKAVFRLSQEKLNFREGVVRCGACRQVFNAKWNLVERTDDGFVITDEESDASDPSAVKQQPDTASPEVSYQADRYNSGELQEPPANELIEPIDSLHSVPLSQRVNSGSDTAPDSTETAEDLAEFESVDSDASDSNDSSRLDSVHDAFVERQLSEDRMDAEVVDLQLPVTDAILDQYDAHSSQSANPFAFDSESELNSAQVLAEDALADRPSQHSINMNGVDHIISHRSNPLMTIAWFFVALGFLFLLGLQAKYFFVDRYAQNEIARPYLGLFCKIAGCQLPARQDLFRFTLTNTKIDLHPAEPGALRVSVKLVNEATFDQPFPNLQLTLTDRVGRVVGRRTFPPDFYLPDGQVNVLNAGQLGSIWFDLANPHEKAVGFVVDIVTAPDVRRAQSI